MQVLARAAEAADVARVFGREAPTLALPACRALAAPHAAARAAVLLEATILVVILVTALLEVAPWSTARRPVAGAFLAFYGAVLCTCTASPYSVVDTRNLAAALRNRVLAPAHAWLYFLDISRFAVDRRGHFRAVGEVATSDLGRAAEEAGEVVAPAAALRAAAAAKHAALEAQRQHAEVRVAAFKARQVVDACFVVCAAVFKGVQ